MGRGDNSGTRSQAERKRRLRGIAGAAIGVAVVAGFATSRTAASANEEGPPGDLEGQAFSTSPHPSSGTVGSTQLKDQATVPPQDLFIVDSLGGELKVDFALWAPGTCGQEDAKPVFTESDEVNGPGNVTTSHSYVPTSVGTYAWTADLVWSGVIPWGPEESVTETLASSGCNAEPVTIDKADTSIATTPTGSGPIGTVIGDTATLSGGFEPTGKITFKLYGVNDPECDGKPLFTESEKLNKDGTAGTADDPFVAGDAGTYHWVASYSGDADNNAVTGLCTDEPQTIGKATPSIASTPSAGGDTGTAVSDSATVSSGDSPSGTVTFKLYGAGDSSCASAPIFSSTVALSGGSAQSGSFSATSEAGTYNWIATYNGDDDNGSVSGKCGDESVVITKPASSVQAAASGPSTPSTGAAQSPMFGMGLMLIGAGLATIVVTVPVAMRQRKRRN